MSMRKYLTPIPVVMLVLCSGNAAAEDHACVNIKMGAGLSAEMRVKSASYTSDWSGTFRVSEMHCKDVSKIPVGEEYTVQVKADGGEKKSCSPTAIRSAKPGSYGWRAKGTIWDVKCNAPD